jgi:hypothetical protein
MKSMIYSILGAVGAAGVLAFIALIVFGPFITIWGLNTLFHLGIPYTFETYFAVIAVGLFFNFRITSKD